jgi:hypothetical protein
MGQKMGHSLDGKTVQAPRRAAPSSTSRLGGSCHRRIGPALALRLRWTPSLAREQGVLVVLAGGDLGRPPILPYRLVRLWVEPAVVGDSLPREKDPYHYPNDRLTTRQ